MLKQFMRVRHLYSYLALGLITAVVTLSNVSASAQGVPHVSVDQTAYHTLIPSGTVITASMCQPGNAFCLAAVGQPLLYSAATQNYGSDSNGNVYVADTSNQIIFKIALSGQITYLTGEYFVQSSTYPPVTQSSALTVLANPSNLVTDANGDLYYSTGYAPNSVVMKIDSAGVAHRLTAPSSLATTAPVEGALASSQYVSPSSLSLSASGDLYIADQNTCTVRVLSAKYGTLDTKYGSLATPCTGVAPTSGQKIGSANVYGSGIALGLDGTIYFSFDNLSLYSVTTDGTAHLLATCQSCTGYVSSAYAGPASTASIGQPFHTPIVDAAGNVYLSSEGANDDPSGDPPYNQYSYIVEVTKGSKALPSQVLVLASTLGGFPYANLNAEGTPSSLIRAILPAITLDSFGRIVMSNETPFPPTGSVNAYGVGYLDRNGAGVFSAPSSQTFTLTNSGSAPLKSTSFARTGLPFYVSPTAVELKDVGYQGPAPFTLDLTSGTCVALYLKSGVVTLQPGESCTIVIDYKQNANLPAAGSVTFQTNDPRGPLTIDLSVSAVTTVNTADTFGEFPDSYYGLDISSIVLAPSLVNNNGRIVVAATVASSLFDPNMESDQNSGQVPTIPTGRVLTAITNNATGAVTVSPANTLDADGKTSFNFTGLAAGSYSLEGMYVGDGKSPASYSTVQTVIVAPH